MSRAIVLTLGGAALLVCVALRVPLDRSGDAGSVIEPAPPAVRATAIAEIPVRAPVLRAPGRRVFGPAARSSLDDGRIVLGTGVHAQRLGSIAGDGRREAVRGTAATEATVLGSLLAARTGSAPNEAWFTSDGDGVALTVDEDGNVIVHSIESGSQTDLTGDGVIDALDLAAFADRLSTADAGADITLDGQVDELDAIAFLHAWAGSP